MTPPPPRERVVLAQRRGARMVRTRVEVAEQTGVGEHLVRGLMRAQLGLALRLGGLVAALFVALPILVYFFPEQASARLLGIPVNWLVLGVLLYPVLYLAGRLYIRFAEQAERDFIRVVDDEAPRPPGRPGV